PIRWVLASGPAHNILFGAVPAPLGLLPGSAKDEPEARRLCLHAHDERTGILPHRLARPSRRWGRIPARVLDYSCGCRTTRPNGRRSARRVVYAAFTSASG